jgi:hypothetical protein
MSNESPVNLVSALAPGTQVFIITQAQPRQVMQSMITQVTIRADGTTYVLHGHNRVVDSGAIHMTMQDAFAV